MVVGSRSRSGCRGFFKPWHEEISTRLPFDRPKINGIINILWSQSKESPHNSKTVRLYRCRTSPACGAYNRS